MCQSRFLHELAKQRDPLNGCPCSDDEKAEKFDDFGSMGRIPLRKSDVTPHPHSHSSGAVSCSLCGDLQK